MDSDFDFDEKRREFSRGGKLIPLCRLHAQMVALLLKAGDTPIGAPTMAVVIGLSSSAVTDEFPDLARRLRPLGIRIGASPRGRWLVFGPMPPKWEPNIPPVTDDPALMKIPS